MKYLILFFSTSLVASQALTKFEEEKAVIVQEYKNLTSDARTIYTDIMHPETALENAIEAYIEKVVKAEAEKLAREAAKKILEELHLTWLEKGK